MTPERRRTLFQVLALGAIALVGSGILFPATISATSQDPPVVFVHYDYMGEAPGGYDLKPSKEGIDRVVRAFRDHGITLVIDPRHTVLPYSPRLGFGFCNPEDTGCANFFDLKAKYFHPLGNQAWHYAIFGDIGTNGGGNSALPGYDFQVANGPEQSCPSDGFDACVYNLAGLFMHELGHNLGLHHGGDVDENFKPNYVSVMNYNFTSGIWYAAAPGQSKPIGLRLDYSDRVLPTLNESHLDERLGLGGPFWSTDVSFYFGCVPFGIPACGAREFFALVPVAAGPVDWNQNGVIEPDVLTDLNAGWSTYQLTNPTGFDDWQHVRQFIGAPAHAAGLVRTLRVVP